MENTEKNQAMPWEDEVSARDEDFADVIPDEEEPATEAASEPEEEPEVTYTSPYASSPYEQLVTPTPVAAKPKKHRKNIDLGKRLVAALLVLALVISSCAVTAALVSSKWKREHALLEQVMDNKLEAMREELQAGSHNPAADGNLPGASTDLLTPGQVYARNLNAVVAVANQSVTYGQVSETASSGSGFIISEDGYVVSNYHVVEGATSLTVIMADGKEYDAQLVGFDATNDISLMKIEGEKLPHVTIGSSDALLVGDMVAAIGNPLGELTSTLTVGYISAKDRIVNTEGVAINMLQTDAAINSGNSGGPLFNMYGEVIGITTAKYSGTSNSGVSIEGIGFAIPMDDVIGMLSDIQLYGYVTGAYLGVMVRDVEAAVQAYGLPAGAYVESVTAGSAAEKAGIKAQDIIINLGGYDITSLNSLTRVLRKFKAGDTTTVTVYRAGQRVNLIITFDEKPQTQQEQTPQQNPQQPQNSQPTDPQYDYPEGFDWFFDYWNPFFGFGG